MDINAATWENCIEHVTATDIGLRRSNNQDSVAVAVAGSVAAFQQRGNLYMVADGMVAHAAGELASKLAVDIVPLAYQKLADRALPDALRAAVEDANAQIHGRGRADPDFRGMGTTSTALVLLPQGAVAAQVGDSRAYRLRGDQFAQLTFDHSLVWEMRAAGQLPGDQVPEYIPKNVITRSLGPSPTVQVDIEGPFPLLVGDTFLLCSDGLSGQVKDAEMGAILQCLPLAEAATTLIDLANLRGGPDNITLVLVRVTAPLPLNKAAEGPRPPSRRRPIPPAVWIVLTAFGAARAGNACHGAVLVGSDRLDRWPAALPRAAAWRSGGGPDLSWARLHRRGPYAVSQCAPNAEFANQLASIAREVRDAATNGHWAVDWAQFNGKMDSGTYASQASDYCPGRSLLLPGDQFHYGRAAATAKERMKAEG